MNKNADMRAQALDSLIAMDSGGRLSTDVMSETLFRNQFLDRKDRAFYRRLCDGVLERRIYLDYVLDTYSKTSMRKCRPLIRNLLRMSAYQILFMNVPDSAAVNEAVRLAKARGFHRLTGFVNGVLRTLCRKKDQLPQPDPDEGSAGFLSIMYSMPRWLVELLLDQYGEETCRKILASFMEERPMTIRRMVSEVSEEELVECLRADGVRALPGRIFPFAMCMEGFDHLTRLKAFREGYFVVQDESSMLPAAIAGISPGDTVIDVCASPGGKSLHAADRLGGSGLVIARDLSEAKTELIRENADRLGVDNIRIEEWDAREFDPDLEERADLVIADLPCSGLGVAGRKKDIRYNLTPEGIRSLIELQRDILSVVWRYVRPGGELIYSTCTINKAENEENVRWIMEHTPLVPVSFEEKLPECLKGRGGSEGALTLIPGQDDCDGFFAAKFVRPEGQNAME